MYAEHVVTSAKVVRSYKLGYGFGTLLPHIVYRMHNIL